MVVGLALAIAGTLFQGLFRNPLADPAIIGVSSGAALGAVAVIVLGGGAVLGGFGVSVAAFVGASFPYVVLKLGFGPTVSVVSAFLGYASASRALEEQTFSQLTVVRETKAGRVED